MNPILTEEGINQARQLRVPQQDIYCSDLLRAFQTATWLTSQPKTIYRRRELRPWNVGVYQGQPSELVHPKLNRLYHKPHIRVPFGESFDEFLRRFCGWLMTVKQDCTLVTHFRNCKVLMAWQAGGWERLDQAVMDADDVKPAAVLTFTAPW